MSKILIEVGCLTRGGAERVASLWANGFAQRGHLVTLVTNAKENTSATYYINSRIKTINIYCWLGMKLSWFLHIHWIMEWKLRKVINEVKPDVIICVLPPWARWSLRATKGMNIRIINTEHNSFERPDSAPMSKQEWYEKFVWNKRYDHVTVLTQADKDVIGQRLDNVTVLPNPLTFEPVKQMPEKSNVILAMGRLNAGHTKGFDVLIKAFGMTSTNWSLQIAGGGKPKAFERYMKLARECGVADRVRFTGFVSDPVKLFREAAVFVLSSRYEGFGMVLIEAMSQGCAPIACDYKGRQREIITNESEGILCEPDNPLALSKAMMKMISNAEYRETVQQNAIERSKFYSLTNIMDRWEKILNDINKKL